MLASLVVIVSLSEAHSDLRTTRDVHTVNKCLQSTQVKLCPFLSNLNCILDEKNLVLFLCSELHVCGRFFHCFHSAFWDRIEVHATQWLFQFMFIFPWLYKIDMHKLGSKQNLHRNYYSRFPDWVYVRCICVRWLLC